jgi:peroxiredoxin
LGVALLRGVSSAHPKVILSAGETAPDFDLPALVRGVKKRFHLQDALAGKNVVLAFYPGNWESLSARQLVEYQQERPQFAARNTEIVAISVDSIMNTTEWERELGPFDFPLCSDFWPHGEVSQAYGVFLEAGPQAGKSERAIVVVEQGGKISFSKVYAQHMPSLAETLEALRRQ